MLIINNFTDSIHFVDYEMAGTHYVAFDLAFLLVNTQGITDRCIAH